MFKLKLIPAVLAILGAGLLAGCQETGEGMAKDTERNAEDTAAAANKAMNEAGEVAAAAGAATTLTPRLKTAIAADRELNDSRNTINVDSTEDTVTLSGTVYSEAIKAKAEQVVSAEMKQANANQKLVNNLTVGQ